MSFDLQSYNYSLNQTAQSLNTNHNQRLCQYLQCFPELETEQSARKFYRIIDKLGYASDNRLLQEVENRLEKQDQDLINFWKKVIKNYNEQVAKSFTFNILTLVNDLSLHEFMPYSLPAIILKCMSEQMIQKQKIMSYYQLQNKENTDQSSYLWRAGTYLSSKIYQNTLGYYFSSSSQSQLEESDFQNCILKESLQIDVINIEFLEKISVIIQREFEDIKMNIQCDQIFEESFLKKIIQKYLISQDFIDIEENADIIMNHFYNTKRLAKGSVSLDENRAVKLVKFANNGEFFLNSSLSDNEMASFQLKILIDKVSRQIEEKNQKVKQYNQEIIYLAKNNQKETSIKLLRKRKQIEKIIGQYYDKKLKMEEVLLSIEQGKQNYEIFESLKIATKASKQIKNLNEYQELFDEFSELESQNQEVVDLFSNQVQNSDQNDKVLLDELNSMENDQIQNQKIDQNNKNDSQADKESEDQTIKDLDRRLQELLNFDYEVQADKKIKTEKQLVHA